VRGVQKAFTLIELMLVVAIISVLAAIALPLYSEFAIRTRVAELVAAAAKFKGAIAEKALNDGILTRAGAFLTVVPSGRVIGGAVTNDGVISVYGSKTSIGTDVTIVLTPSLATDGKVLWTCSAAPNLHKYVPSECRH